MNYEREIDEYIGRRIDPNHFIRRQVKNYLLTHIWYNTGPAQTCQFWLSCIRCGASLNPVCYGPPGGYKLDDIRVDAEPCHE